MIRRLLTPLHRRHARRILGASLVAVSSLGSFACHKAPADDESDSTAAVIGAKTIVVQPQAFTETIGAIGSVEPRAGHLARLSAPIAGRVANVLVASGQHVSIGQPLIELDQAPFRAATASAQAALSAAERANERSQRLANEGILPRKDADATAADLAKARADAAAAEREEALSVLRAPIGGVVTQMSATLGASVDPAQPLVEIADPSALDIVFGVTPTEAGRVHPGAKVTLSAGQSATGEALGIGSVVDVSGTVDSASRSVDVRVQAPTTRRPLRIGETVFGAIAVQTNPAAITVPLEALVPNGETFRVFVVDPTGTAHARDVVVGGKTDAVAEITSGLRAGERVVTYGAYGVNDSAKIAPMTPVPAAGKAPPAPPPAKAP
jgi:membrane fusion protein (multidrug efflux system)